ncbi:MAG TPA: thioredoxin family protein [Terriglobales bacterium]|nr:thioredoxin family protein [Terriglobales bacterium]
MQYPDYPITTSVTPQIVTNFNLSSPYTGNTMFRPAHLTLRRLPILLLLTTGALAETAGSFPALLNWKAVIIRGNLSLLQQLYSTDPLARVTVVIKNPTDISVQQDAEFWTGLRARRLSLNVSQSTSPRPGLQQVTFEATITPALPGRTLYVLASQLWQQQGSSWKLVAVERTDAYRLEQPMSVDAKLYPPASAARGEIQKAIARAAKTHKRVLIVFGADWCYDCHVLDKAFKRPDVAPTLNSNFEVVHVDVGEGDKNQDLMDEYQVPMKRGIPALAVLDSNGKLIFSQKNGEFERARAMGPEDLVAFLNHWKPD